MKMNKGQINYNLARVVEYLERARPGCGTTEQRAANRGIANEILKTMPRNWHAKADEALLSRMGELA